MTTRLDREQKDLMVVSHTHTHTHTQKTADRRTGGTCLFFRTLHFRTDVLSKSGKTNLKSLNQVSNKKEPKRTRTPRLSVCVGLSVCVCFRPQSALLFLPTRSSAPSAEGQTGPKVDDLQEGAAGPPDLVVFSTSPDFTWNTRGRSGSS